MRVGNSRFIRAFGHHLDLSSSKERVIEGHGRAHRVLVGELHVGKALRMSVELVAQDSDAIDGPAAVKMLFQFFGRGSVVNIAHVHGPPIHLHLLFVG